MFRRAAAISKLLIKEQKDDPDSYRDATDDDSSTTAGYIKITDLFC
jgi:hypothetical protein